MLLQVHNGELVMPSCFAVSVGLLVLFLYSLAFYTLVQETREDRVCRFTPQQQLTQTTAGHVTQHPGCQAGPEYTSREECPGCFSPSVVTNFSDGLFQPLSEEQNLFPRGPASIFKPHPMKQQSLADRALMVPLRVCVETCPYMVVLVLSSPRDWEVRDQIRGTWASVASTKLWPGQGKLKAQIGVIFVLGLSDNLQEGEIRKVREESEVFGDILFLSVVDIYSNLALKGISALKWSLQHCSTSKFFLKIDQDTFLNVPFLLDLLVYHEHRLKLSVTGHIYTRPRFVLRSGRWEVSLLDYPMNEFPVYAAGCAYVLSRRASERVTWLFPYYPRWILEDVLLTGLLAREARLEHFSPAHNSYFAESTTDHTKTWCKFLREELVTMTAVDTRNKRFQLWSNLISNHGQCQLRDLGDLNAACWLDFPSP